jgi:hypothetical protein
MLILVNAMIPEPDETAGEWWSTTGATEAREKAAARRGYAKEFLYLASALTLPEIVIGSPCLRSLILLTSQQCGLLLVRPSGLR